MNPVPIDPALLSIGSMPLTPNQFTSQDRSADIDGRPLGSPGEPVRCLVFKKFVTLSYNYLRSRYSRRHARGHSSSCQCQCHRCHAGRWLVRQLFTSMVELGIVLTVCFSKGFKLEQLKAQCRAHKLKVGGRKNELVSRLENDDSRQSQMSSPRWESA